MGVCLISLLLIFNIENGLLDSILRSIGAIGVFIGAYFMFTSKEVSNEIINERRFKK